MEQRATAHVHLVARQLAVFDVYREGVGELHAELQPLALRELLQTAEHHDRVIPLQILFKMMLVKGDVIEPRLVEDRARVLVAEDGGIALDEGVQSLLRQQIGRDPLDLIGRTSVERGQRDTAAYARRNAVDQLGIFRVIFF